MVHRDSKTQRQAPTTEKEKIMAKTNTAPKMSTAIAIVAAPSAAMDGLRQVLSAYHKADKQFETAQIVRSRCVLAFADTCKKMGWENLDAIKAKGQHRAELVQVAASCILNAAQMKAFGSDMAAYKTGADGKRIYSAKHNAGVIVANFLDRLIAAVEKVFDNDAPSAENGGKEGADKGANANKAKGLAEYMATTFADMVKRNGNDARKEAPTGSNHAKVKAELERCAKVIADLLK
jgi:hypothetical protein